MYQGKGISPNHYIKRDKIMNLDTKKAAVSDLHASVSYLRLGERTITVLKGLKPTLQAILTHSTDTESRVIALQLSEVSNYKKWSIIEATSLITKLIKHLQK